jgi:hypothetical protein
MRKAMAAAILGLVAGGVHGQTGAGPDMGVTLVPLQVVIIGPVISCGQVRLPSGTRYSGLQGCPAAIEVIPGHYRPVPRAGWRLTRCHLLHSQVYRYECVNHYLFGFFPIVVSQECVGPDGPVQGSTFVVSWQAAPVDLPDDDRLQGAGER